MNFRQRLTAGNLDRFRSRSILNVPLTDSAAIKLGYAYSQRDGFVDNEGNGEDWGIEERDNITADFHWTASETVTLDYKFDRSTIEDTSRLSQVLAFDGAAPASSLIVFQNPALDAQGNPVEASKDRLDEATSFDNEVAGDVEITAHTLDVAWYIDDMLSFRSITGYRDVDAFNQTAQSPTTSLFGTYTIVNGITDTTFEQFSQEFQLLGESNHWSWVAGVYYYEDESEETNSGNSNGSEEVPPELITDFTSTENTSIAVFGQATWTPPGLERWAFTLGARYSDDNRKASRDNTRVSFGFGGAPTPIPPFVVGSRITQFGPWYRASFEDAIRELRRDRRQFIRRRPKAVYGVQDIAGGDGPAFGDVNANKDFIPRSSRLTSGARGYRDAELRFPGHQFRSGNRYLRADRRHVANGVRHRRGTAHGGSGAGARTQPDGVAGLHAAALVRRVQRQYQLSVPGRVTRWRTTAGGRTHRPQYRQCDAGDCGHRRGRQPRTIAHCPVGQQSAGRRIPHRQHPPARLRHAWTDRPGHFR
ncbi:MAG: hypothetical protein U5K56_01390 [Halioglobus sp.]|nr:hypothetical protein [Halioglobus sp.]